MNFIPGTRLLSEASFYYLLLLLFPWNLPVPFLLGAAALCGLGCSLAGLAGKRTVLRCLTALIPLTALLLPSGLTEKACIAAPILYSILLILSNRVYADAWLYARHVKFSMIFALLLMIIGCTLRTERTAGYALFCTLYFICGIYYQRQLRLGGGVNLSSRLRDLAVISALPAGAGTIVLIVFEGLEPISRLVIGFTTMIGFAMRYVVQLASNLYVYIPTEVQTATRATTEAVEETVLETTAEETVNHLLDNVTLSPEALRAIVLAGILAAIGLLLYGISRFTSRPTPARAEHRWAEANGTMAEMPVNAVRRADSNRKKVRKAYSTYLHLLQGKGLFRKRTDTSQEILDASAAFTESPAGAELRNIYIRARYHTGQPVTDEEVQEAGRILKEFRKNN